MCGEKQEEDIFSIKARRCKRCGGILTSKHGIQAGYGSCCLRKIQQEERDRKEEKNQYSLFPKNEP